jgi:hypothetical protein
LEKGNFSEQKKFGGKKVNLAKTISFAKFNFFPPKFAFPKIKKNLAGKKLLCK